MRSNSGTSGANSYGVSASPCRMLCTCSYVMRREEQITPSETSDERPLRQVPTASRRKAPADPHSDAGCKRRSIIPSATWVSRDQESGPSCRAGVLPDEALCPDDIIRHIGDMHLQLIPAIFQLANQHRIVEVFRSLAIDGDNRQATKIAASLSYLLLDFGFVRRRNRNPPRSFSTRSGNTCGK